MTSALTAPIFNVGAGPDDPSADDLLAAFGKAEAAFAEVRGTLATKADTATLGVGQLVDVAAAIKGVLTAANLAGARTALGLGNVADVAPADLPISTAVATALATLNGLVTTCRATLDVILGGANPAVDTFVEVYQRFLADETAATAVTATLATLQAALNAEVIRAGAAEAAAIAAAATDASAKVSVEAARAATAEGLLTPKARAIATPAAGGLAGGGDLSADRNLSIAGNGVTNAMLAQAPTLTLKANLLGSTANVTDVTLSALLDAVLGSARGGMLYRGAAGWAALAAGTSGRVLTAGGAGADPAWADVPTGNGVAASGSPTAGQTALFASGSAIKGATAAQARAAAGLNDAGAVAFRNRIINGSFAINQRGAASASTAYSAGAYVMDRWKAGSNGCTLSWSAAANGDVTATITAGTLVQVIEGGLYLVEGGAYVLSWAGTATARVWQGSAGGSYAASPVAVTGLTAATNAVVEVSTGTVTLAQFEPGASPTPFERRDDELRRAQRYYEAGTFQVIGNGYTATAYIATALSFKATKRTANPAVSAALPTYNNLSGVNINSVSAEMAMFYSGVANAGNASGTGTYTASSEL